MPVQLASLGWFFLLLLRSALFNYKSTGPEQSPAEDFGEVSEGTKAQKLVSSKVHRPVISDTVEAIGEGPREVKDLVRRKQERGQAWETRMEGVNFVFPSECVLVP